MSFFNNQTFQQRGGREGVFFKRLFSWMIIVSMRNVQLESGGSFQCGGVIRLHILPINLLNFVESVTLVYSLFNAFGHIGLIFHKFYDFMP